MHVPSPAAKPAVVQVLCRTAGYVGTAAPSPVRRQGPALLVWSGHSCPLPLTFDSAELLCGDSRPRLSTGQSPAIPSGGYSRSLLLMLMLTSVSSQTNPCHSEHYRSREAARPVRNLLSLSITTTRVERTLLSAALDLMISRLFT